MSDPQFTPEELVGLYLNLSGTMPLHPGKSAWTAEKQHALVQKLDGMVNTVIVEKLENKYYCEDCDRSWIDIWCCACDDKCPGCNKSYSPSDSITLKTFRLRLKTEPCKVCGNTHDF